MTPEWLENVKNVMQEWADAKYADNLKIFNSGAADWVTANIINRDIGVPLSAFTKPIPARTVFVIDAEGHLDQKDVTDPSIKAPVLPPGGPKVFTPNTIDVGRRINAGWYAVGPMDTFAPGKRTPPIACPDGETHELVKVAAPVGTNYVTLSDGTVAAMGGWYEVVG